jgi:PRTRC genetic system ThiF family protein
MLALHTARIAREALHRYQSVSVTFIDPDIVEDKNIRRQNFCPSEVGLNKAETLAYRLNAAWGLNIKAIPHRYTPDLLTDKVSDCLTILLGCVDNAAARRALHQTLLKTNRFQNDISSIWWIDGGNSKTTGQVLLGNATTPDLLKNSFSLNNICTNLPSPALLHPELLISKPDEQVRRQRSCAELAMADPQSLTINSIIAAHMADYLLRLTLTNDLRRFATYIDMGTGSIRSLAITPDQLRQALEHDRKLARHFLNAA